MPSTEYPCPNDCAGSWEVAGEYHPGYPRSRYHPGDEGSLDWDGEPLRAVGTHDEGCTLTEEQETQIIKAFEEEYYHEYLDLLAAERMDYEEEW